LFTRTKSINFLTKGGGEITIIIQGDFSDFCIIFTTAPLQNSQTYQCVTLEQSKIPMCHFRTVKIPMCHFRTVKHTNVSIQNSQTRMCHFRTVKHTNVSLQNSQTHKCVTSEQSNTQMCHFRIVKHTNVSLQNSYAY
jgi:hypothetical protein